MKDKTFDYYLQEALKELEKPCEEFNSARCEWLLQNCVYALLQGEYGLRKDENSKAVKKEFQSVSKVAQYPKRQFIVFAEELQFPGGYCHGKTTVLLSSPSHNRSCSCGGNGLNGSCNGLLTACSSVFSPRRPSLSAGRDADSSYGRLHSNPPKGGGIGEVSRLQSGQGGLLWVIVDNSTEETIQVNPTKDPAEALAEALSKLTPGVKTSIWREE